MPRDLLPMFIVLVVLLPWLALLTRPLLRKGKIADDRQQLEERLHVLERIVTDPSVGTAAQIEALKDPRSVDR